MANQISMNDYETLLALIENENILNEIKRKNASDDTFTVEYEGYPLRFVEDTKVYFLAFLKYLKTLAPTRDVTDFIQKIEDIREKSSHLKDPGFLQRFTLISKTPAQGVKLLSELKDFLLKSSHTDKLKVEAIKKACDDYSAHLGERSNDHLQNQKIQVVSKWKTKLADEKDPKAALNNFSNVLRNEEDLQILSHSRDGYFKNFIKFILNLTGCKNLIKLLDDKTVTGKLFIGKTQKLASKSFDKKNENKSYKQQ